MIKYFLNVVPIYKNVSWTISEKQQKIFKKRLSKGIEIFLKKRKTKSEKCKRYKNLSQDKKQRLVEYRT